jgi:leader peptidase (prepilin peptidase)/N-methyltransferase
MNNIPYITVALVGLAIGSFMNVLIYRVPRKFQFWKGRSMCPSCGKQLKWYHNIPVVSFLILRGRCGFCKARIPVRYPIVELLNAGAYIYFAWRVGVSWEFAAYAFLASALIVIFLIDLEFQIIPDMITLPGMALGLAWSLTPEGIGIVNSLIGLAVGGGSLYLIALLGDWLFKKESMGGGDIKMAAMLGAFLGWEKVLFVFVASAVVGLVVSVVLMFFSPKIREQRVVPFGPFIAIAAVLAILWGDRIIAFYLHHFVGLS